MKAGMIFGLASVGLSVAGAVVDHFKEANEEKEREEHYREVAREEALKVYNQTEEN